MLLDGLWLPNTWRINESGNYTYRTKGDNNIAADTALVNGNKIHGKVLFKIPKIGYIYNFIANSTFLMKFF